MEETKDQARRRVVQEQTELCARLDAMTPTEREAYFAKQPSPIEGSRPRLTDAK